VIYSFKIEQILEDREADIISEETEFNYFDNQTSQVIYSGYYRKQSVINSPEMAIKKTIIRNNITVVLWANGNKAFTEFWDNRHNYNYLFLFE
jgi:hypothetical protein